MDLIRSVIMKGGEGGGGFWGLTDFCSMAGITKVSSAKGFLSVKKGHCAVFRCGGPLQAKGPLPGFQPGNPRRSYNANRHRKGEKLVVC